MDQCSTMCIHHQRKLLIISNNLSTPKYSFSLLSITYPSNFAENIKIKDMGKLSIRLLLIASLFMAMGVNASYADGIQLKAWDRVKRMPVCIPINATLIDNNIEVQFLQSNGRKVTIQIKDKYGNVVLQKIVAPNENEIYKIKLDGLNPGQYELLYLENNTNCIGNFYVN